MRTRTVRFSTLTIDDVDIPIRSGRLVLAQYEADASSLSGPSKIDGTRKWYADVVFEDHQAPTAGLATFGTDEGPATGQVLSGPASIRRNVRARLAGTGDLDGITWP